VELNQPAPDFELRDLNDHLHRLSDSLGRIVILNFWSAECPQCERVDADLLTCLREWNGRVTLLTLAANVNETDEFLAAAARERGLMPVLLANRTPVPDEYGALTTPHLFIVDASGILRYRGAFDDVTFRQRTPTKFYLKDAAEALLAGNMPEVAETAPYGCAVIRFVLE
jgi:peroxiredoxin